MPLTPLPAAVFAAWRWAVGLWATALLVGLWPWRLELYSAQGLPPLEGAWWVIFPSPLWLHDGPLAVSALLVVGIAAALGLAVGVRRGACALVLWAVLASLLARNPLAFDLSWTYTGWSLLACALVPPGEPRWPWRPAAPGWALPPLLHGGAVAVLGASYTVSGLSKLARPEWWSGEAVPILLGSGVAREGVARVLEAPPGLLHAASWFVLGAELLSGPLALHRRTRLWGWSAMVLVHLGILATVRLGSLSVGMLIFHLLALDLSALRRRTRAAEGA